MDRVHFWSGSVRPLIVLAFSLIVLAACSGQTRAPGREIFGADPALPAPQRTLIPTIKVAEATGWAEGETPVASQGLAVKAFARGLDHPRWLYVLPNGDVLVAESNAPPKPKDGGGIAGMIAKALMSKAGAVTPSANRITLLRDADGDGAAEIKQVFLTGLNSPFGMTLVKDRLYVANTDAIVSFPYKPGDTSISAVGATLTDLPAGEINHHWTKNIIASPDGAKIYATVGSNSNVGENGMLAEEGRAAIWEVDVASGVKTLFATGLRNPNGMDWNPASGQLWTAVNERDALGDNLVPDYITSVKHGAFYGWPWSYFGQNVDVRVKPENPAMVARALKPDYAVGAHTASLGLTFATGAKLGPRFADGVFVGQHGSWNRNPPAGYRVIFVPFAGAQPSGDPITVLDGFLYNEKARGRPVGVIIAKDGALLVSDDVGNVIWRVRAAPAPK